MSEKKKNHSISILAILAILAASAGIFFMFTLKKAQEKIQNRNVDTPQEKSQTGEENSEPVTAEAKHQQKIADTNAQALDALRKKHLAALAAGLSARDMEAVEAMFTPGDNPDQPRVTALVLERIVHELGYTPDLAAATPAPAGSKPDSYLLPFTRSKEEKTERHDLWFEFNQVPEGRPFTAVELPPALGSELQKKPIVAKPEQTPPSATPSPQVDPEQKDAPSPAEIVASRFVDAVIKLDYRKARAQSIPQKLPAEKVAALCFVFEDAQVRIDAETHIRVTAATEETAWAITKIYVPAWKEELEFGMEIERRPTVTTTTETAPKEKEGPEAWGIAAINLSDVLARYAARTEASEIPYTPIVKKPNGGESLVLYFPYDSDAIHPRAKRQLEIIAQLLESDEAKKIRITGHTDAHGSTGYNDELSGERASEVREFLVTAGIPNAQIITEAAGELLPLAPNEKADGTDNPEGRARNRRAEIYLDF